MLDNSVITNPRLFEKFVEIHRLVNHYLAKPKVSIRAVKAAAVRRSDCPSMHSTSSCTISLSDINGHPNKSWDGFEKKTHAFASALRPSIGQSMLGCLMNPIFLEEIVVRFENLITGGNPGTPKMTLSAQARLSLIMKSSNILNQQTRERELGTGKPLR